MKVNIYRKIPAKDKELEFKLKLFRFSDCVVVALADERGERIEGSSLVSITDDMEIVRCTNISDHLGIPLVSLSRLKIQGVED